MFSGLAVCDVLTPGPLACSDNNRAMATYSTYNKQTVEGCLAYCAQKGYFLGAVENGKVCGTVVFHLFLSFATPLVSDTASPKPAVTPSTGTTALSQGRIATSPASVRWGE
jgi:hypothetical protein